MRILILRPAPGGAATARAVAAMGHDAIETPLFEIAPMPWSPPDPAQFDAVAMTSVNAARHAGAALVRYLHLPVFAVGAATATAAQAAGFADVESGPGDAARLGALLGDRRVLHLTGSDHRDLGIGATVVVVYAARAITVALPAADVVLVHSPRAGVRLAALVADRGARAIVAISEAAAAACGSGWRSVDVAASPDENAMLETLARVCEAPPR